MPRGRRFGPTQNKRCGTGVNIMTDHERDATHLTWLSLSEAGKTSGQIAKAYGTTSATIRVALNRIKGDLEKSEA